MVWAVSAAALVAAACSSAPGNDGAAPPKVEEKEQTASVSAAVAGASCQVNDLAAHVTSSQGASTTFAIGKDGRVWGWGYNGDGTSGSYAPLGISQGAKVWQPVVLQRADGKTSTQLAPHQNGACAINTDATVTCFGQPLGSAAPPPSDSALVHQLSLVDGNTEGNLTGVTGIAAGNNHACAVKSGDNSLWCWGADNKGQLADGASPYSSGVGGAQTVAYPVFNTDGSQMLDAKAVAAAADTTCVLRLSGEVDCVGGNANGELGQAGGPGGGVGPSGLLSPVNVPAGTVFTSLTAGGGASGGTFCASTSASEYCWGLNSWGQALISNTKSATAPIAPGTAGMSPATDPGAAWSQGDLNGCEINQAGSLSCWGSNSNAEIPATTSSWVSSATPITFPAGAGTVFKSAIGDKHMCAATQNGLYCWGLNSEGEIGNNTNAPLAGMSQIHLTPPAQCEWWYACGQVTNACGEATNCGSNNGGCAANFTCDAPTHTCVSCGSTPVSATANANGVTVPLYSSGFTETSPATYGSEGCSDQWVVDVTSATNNWGRPAQVQPANFPQDQTTCGNTRVQLTAWAYGALSSTTGYISGTWNNVPPGGIIRSYCSFNNASLAFPSGPSDVRFAASAQQWHSNLIFQGGLEKSGLSEEQRATEDGPALAEELKPSLAGAEAAKGGVSDELFIPTPIRFGYWYDVPVAVNVYPELK